MGSDEFSGLTKRPAGGWVLQESIVREWAKRFPEEMFMTIHRERLPEDDPRREWAGQAIDQWMEESPSEAIAFLDDMPRGSGGNGDEFHLGAVASAKRRGDYDLAIELEAKWPNGAWVGTDADKFQAWYSAQPQAALAKIASIGDSRLRGNYLKQVGRLSAGRPEEEIVDAISSFSALDREAFVEGVIGEMAQESPVKAIRFHERNFPGMSAAVGPAVIQWAKEAPSEALQWSKENLYGKVFGEVVTIVVRQRGFEDMGSAQELLMEIEPGKVRNQAAAELFNDCVNGKAGSVLEVAEWIVSFPDELTRSYMLEKSWSQLTVRSPDLGMLLCAGDDPAIASERRIGEFAKILHASQRKEFERWLESLPERNRRIAEQAVK